MPEIPNDSQTPFCPDHTHSSGYCPVEKAEQLVRYESWLALLARLELGSQFRQRFSHSDIVQQTMMEAFRDFPQFEGSTEAELLAWLRKILAHVIAHQIRHEKADKRDIARDVSIEASLEASSLRMDSFLADSGPSPSRVAMTRENSVILADVLARLPEDYREVIILRNIEGLPHEEIAKRMERGVGAVRMLWVRALARLREIRGTE